jgi:hypothetical protein
VYSFAGKADNQWCEKVSLDNHLRQSAGFGEFRLSLGSSLYFASNFRNANFSAWSGGVLLVVFNDTSCDGVVTMCETNFSSKYWFWPYLKKRFKFTEEE